jgi:predicted RNA-binding Zn-ribbon protein involved in translation (DUF1610 family)
VNGLPGTQQWLD